MLLQKPLPGSAGYRSDPYRNIGEISNTGFETNLIYQNLRGRIKYRFQAILSYNRNNVTSLGGITPISGASMSSIGRGYLTRTEEGYPLAGFYGWIMDGVFQSWEEVNTSPFQTSETAPGDIKFRDLDGDNRITGEDRAFIGNPWPDLTYGFNADLEYLNFSLSVFLQGVQGNEIYLMDSYTGLSGSANHAVRVLEDHYWTPENRSQTMPRAIAGDPNDNSRFSTRFIEDGSYMRIKNIVLSYTIPEKIAAIAKMSSAQVFLKANNLYTFTKFPGLDPEIGEFNNNALSSGIAMGQYPVARTFSIGVNVNF
jgi:hypothetical protein